VGRGGGERRWGEAVGGGGVQVDKWVGHTGLIAGGCDRDVRACGIGLGWGVWCE